MIDRNGGVMTKQEEVLFANLYLPTLVKQAAVRGIQIKDQETLNSVLETTALLKQAIQAQETNVIKSAADQLKATLGIKPEQTSVTTETVKTAANSDVRKALFETLSGK
jgi:hypothetical protein